MRLKFNIGLNCSIIFKENKGKKEHYTRSWAEFMAKKN